MMTAQPVCLPMLNVSKSTIFMLLAFPLGIIGVKGVILDPESSSWRRYCCCSAVVISTIIMSGLILLRVSAAPPARNPSPP